EVAQRQPGSKIARPIMAPPMRISSTRPLGNSRTSSGLPKLFNSAAPLADWARCVCACSWVMVMSVSSVLLGGDDPVLEGRLALALHHHGGVELVAANRAIPEELPVLGTHRFGLEAHRVAGSDRLVRRIAVAVLI